MHFGSHIHAPADVMRGLVSTMVVRIIQVQYTGRRKWSQTPSFRLSSTLVAHQTRPLWLAESVEAACVSTLIAHRVYYMDAQTDVCLHSLPAASVHAASTFCPRQGWGALRYADSAPGGWTSSVDWR